MKYPHPGERSNSDGKQNLLAASPVTSSQGTTQSPGKTNIGTYDALVERITTFDELLEACGGNGGRYQIKLLLIVGILCGAGAGVGLSFYFIGRPVLLRCPYNDEGTADASCAASDKDDGDVDICDWYSSEGLGDGKYRYAHSDDTYDSWVSEMALSCDRAYLTEVLTSSYFAGFGLGAWWFGMEADRRGRLPVAKALSFVIFVPQVLTAFAGNVWWLVFLRFVVGIGVGGQLSSAYNLLMEQVSAQRRSLFAGLVWVIWVAVVCLNCLIAWVVDKQYAQHDGNGPVGHMQSWRYSCLVMSVPLLLSIPGHWYLRESPRWVLQQRDFAGADSAVVEAEEEEGEHCSARLPLDNGSRMSSSPTSRDDDERGTGSNNGWGQGEKDSRKLRVVADIMTQMARENRNLRGVSEDTILEALRNIESHELASVDDVPTATTSPIPMEAGADASGGEGVEEEGETRREDLAPPTQDTMRTTMDLFSLQYEVHGISIRRLTVAVSYLWFAVITVYYALSIYCAGMSGGSIYLNVFLATVIEAPVYASSSFIADYFGRKRTIFIALCQSSICAIIIVIIGGVSNGSMLTTGLALFSKLFITVAVSVIYVWSSELYPTDVRGLAFGTANVFARIGGLISPFIVGPTIAEINKDLPLFILAIIAIVAAAFAFQLPETRGLSLPETLQSRRLGEKT